MHQHEKGIYMTHLTARHVRSFLVDGTFGGIVTAEIMNWTGHVLKGQRSQLSVICKRDEAQRTGIYILLGENEMALSHTSDKSTASPTGSNSTTTARTRAFGPKSCSSHRRTPTSPAHMCVIWKHNSTDARRNLEESDWRTPPSRPAVPTCLKRTRPTRTISSGKY